MDIQRVPITVSDVWWTTSLSLISSLEDESSSLDDSSNGGASGVATGALTIPQAGVVDSPKDQDMLPPSSRSVSLKSAKSVISFLLKFDNSPSLSEWLTTDRGARGASRGEPKNIFPQLISYPFAYPRLTSFINNNAFLKQPIN